MPICFGISFTKTFMNQARSLVNVYTDGSVNISTAAVEMGQGVNTKMLQVAAKIFSISPESIKVNSTNTYRIANTSPTAASCCRSQWKSNRPSLRSHFAKNETGSSS
jgi:xanthine dehydrogenase large subunit